MPRSCQNLGPLTIANDCRLVQFVNRLRWLITLPVAILVVVFAVTNRSHADVNLWPLDIVVTWPLFVFVFIGAGIGFLLGTTLMWFSCAPARKKIHERAERVRALERNAAQRNSSQGNDTPARAG
ncbi:MAG: hypothetical protein CL573_05700 [Alphaproteobacteria bacterium]|nr:hypothetical protein [Alphaproteobacteria bacterium]